MSFLIALIWTTVAWLLAASVGVRRFRSLIAINTFVASLAVSLLWGSGYSGPPPEDQPLEKAISGYVGSDSCRSCHPGPHASWHASYHRTMTQRASSVSVVGDFDDVELQIEGRRYWLERRGEEYWVELDDPEGLEEAPIDPDWKPERVWKQVVMTTGSHCMQMYWFSSGDGRMLQKFPFVYLIDEKRWVPRSGVYVSPTRDGVAAHEGLNTGDWNFNCIRCHTTLGRPRINWDDGWADTETAELGIACEACHGPGAEHVAANQNPGRRYLKHFQREQGDDTIVNPARLPHDRGSQVCGQCHGVNSFYKNQDGSVWNEHGYPFRPGQDLAETRFTVKGRQDANKRWVKELLKENPILFEATFWKDDKIRVSGREYNGLLASPCFQRGEMSCFSCHQLHQQKRDDRPIKEWANDQMKPEMLGNQACLQCHPAIGENLSQHTHHGADSSGSLCYNCHMPHTTYGLLKAIRSHTVYSPSTAESLDVGRPNACNLCHLDQTLEWTDKHLSQWYGHSQSELSDEQKETAASVLWLAQGDAALRAIVAWHYGWKSAQEVSGKDWMVPILGGLLDDSYEAVRLLAHQALRQRPEFAEMQYDYVGDPEQRRRAAEEVIRMWGDTFALDRPRPKVLLDDQGRFQQTRFQKLLEKRDDRPITLQE